jgi:tetraacyldisaccharide 4'-kinase
VWSAATRLRGAAARPIRVPGVHVVSVGALAAGGAGKTPLAMEVARRLRDAGVAVAVVLRGYRGTLSLRGALVSEGAGPVLDARRAGDEAVLVARRLPGVLVRIGADRVLATRRARADGARVVVLDDGLQHRRLARDVDVVAVDDVARPDRDGIVLREGTRGLGRATLLAVRGATALPDDPRAFAFDVRPEALVDAGLAPVGPPQDLRGARVVVACGIARPDRFVEAVRALGARVVTVVACRDHAPVAARAAAASRGADLVVTTEKDLVREPDPWKCLPAVGIRVQVVLGAGKDRLEACLSEAARGTAAAPRRSSAEPRTA